jgi:hypothetical protein
MKTELVAFVCVKEAQPYDNLDTIDSRTEPPLSPAERVFATGNCLSAVALALTAAIYKFLKNMQDSHEICIIHMTSSLCILHAYLFYTMIVEQGILFSFCLTNRE